jgi:hypothetical protein
MGQQDREQHHYSRAGGNCLHCEPRSSQPDVAMRTHQAHWPVKSSLPRCSKPAAVPPPPFNRRFTMPASREASLLHAR